MKTKHFISICVTLFILSIHSFAQPRVCEVASKYRNANSIDFTINTLEWNELHSRMMNFKNYYQIQTKYPHKSELFNRADVVILDDTYSLKINILADSQSWFYSSYYFIENVNKSVDWNKSQYLKEQSFPTSTGDLLLYTPLENLMFSKKHLKKKLKVHNDGYVFDFKNAFWGDNLRLFINSNTLFIDSIHFLKTEKPKSIHFEYYGYNGQVLKESEVFPIDSSNQFLQEVFNQKLQEGKIAEQKNDSIKSNFDPAGEFKTLTLLDFWFIGCQPCHTTFPTVEKIRNTYSESQLDIKALGTNKQEDIDRYKAKFGFNLDMLFDVNEYRTKFDVKGYPTKILITPDGRILYRAVGSQINKNEYQILKDIIDEYLNGNNPDIMQKN